MILHSTAWYSIILSVSIIDTTVVILSDTGDGNLKKLPDDCYCLIFPAYFEAYNFTLKSA